MVSAMESRFERYTEMMVKSLGHASREQPAPGVRLVVASEFEF